MSLRTFVFILLILQPMIVKLMYKAGFQINLFNELLSLFVLGLFLERVLIKKSFNSTFFIYIFFLAYTILLGFLRDIMPLSLIQIMSYSQFFFYFYYFQTFSGEEKTQTIKAIKKVMDTIVLIHSLDSRY